MSRPQKNLNLTQNLKIVYFLPQKAKKKIPLNQRKIKSKN